MQSNFLAVPTKRAHPLPTFQTQVLAYISNYFRDAHPDAFKKDVEMLVGMRKEWVESKADIHPEIVRGLMRWVPCPLLAQTQASGQATGQARAERWEQVLTMRRYHAQLSFLATKFPSDVSDFDASWLP